MWFNSREESICEGGLAGIAVTYEYEFEDWVLSLGIRVLPC